MPTKHNHTRIKVLLGILVAVAALSLAGTLADAATYVAQFVYGVRYDKQSSKPSNCAEGRVCDWVDTSSRKHFWNGTSDSTQSFDSNSNWSFSGGWTLNRTAVADAAKTVAAGEYLIAYTSLTTTRNVTLPLASTGAGRVIYISDESGSASSSPKITAQRSGSDTVNGVTTAVDVVTVAYGLAMCTSDGSTKWRCLAASTGGGGGSYYQTVENNGTPLTQRSVLNCDGTLVVCSDDGSETDITLGSTVMRTSADSTLSAGVDITMASDGVLTAGRLVVSGMSTKNAIASGVSDGGAAVAHEFRTTGAYTTDGAKAMSWGDNAERMYLGRVSSQWILNVLGDTNSSAVGPIRAQTTAVGSIGAAVTLDASTGGAGGRAYSFISTGSGAGVGAGSFAVFDGTATAYRFQIDSSGHWLPGADATQDLASSAKRMKTAWTRTTVVGDTNANRPACDATARGSLFVERSNAGVGDIVQACLKGTADSYAWRNVFTAP
jgi:hypothetical protein